MAQGVEERRRTANRPDAQAGRLPRPYLLFLGDTVEAGFAKTAFGLRDWAPELCVGEYALPSARISLGLPNLSPPEAYARGARALVIGVANSGGFIADTWVPALLEALEAGLDIVSGMHAKLGQIAELRTTAERLGRRLIDIRTPPANIPIATGLKRSGKRLLTVGTDCALGKKYTALSIARGFAARGIDTDFRATGQTGGTHRRWRHPDGCGHLRFRGWRGGDVESCGRTRSLGRDRRAGVDPSPRLCRRVARLASRQPARRVRGVSRSQPGAPARR